MLSPNASSAKIFLLSLISLHSSKAQKKGSGTL